MGSLQMGRQKVGMTMEKRSSLLIMLAAALWGGIGVFFKQLSALGFTSMQVVAIRVLTAAITLGIVVLLVDGGCSKFA